MSFYGIENLRPITKKFIPTITDVRPLGDELYPMAKLNKKKTADQVIKNLTDTTKYKFSVQASASGKISITEKIRRGFSMRHLRGK